MTDFRMPHNWYDPPEDEPWCEECDVLIEECEHNAEADYESIMEDRAFLRARGEV